MAGIRDTEAGELLFDLREAKGLSPEQVPHAMRKAGVARLHIPSGRTIRRVEDEGVVPHVRHRFGLAEFYGLNMGQIWEPAKRKVAA